MKQCVSLTPVTDNNRAFDLSAVAIAERERWTIDQDAKRARLMASILICCSQFVVVTCAWRRSPLEDDADRDDGDNEQRGERRPTSSDWAALRHNRPPIRDQFFVLTLLNVVIDVETSRDSSQHLSSVDPTFFELIVLKAADATH